MGGVYGRSVCLQFEQIYQQRPDTVWGAGGRSLSGKADGTGGGHDSPAWRREDGADQRSVQLGQDHLVPPSVGTVGCLGLLSGADFCR